MSEKLDFVASQLLLPEGKRIELMMMVKEGKLSPERAMERAVAMNKKLADEAAREEREKQQNLLRMSAKARAQEAAKNRIKAKEDAIRKQEEQQNRVTMRPSSYVSPPAQVAQVNGKHASQRSTSDASVISTDSTSPSEETSSGKGSTGPAVLLHHVSAHAMRMSETDRVEVMRLVKSGELSVNDAVAHVLLLERNLQAKENNEPIVGGKRVFFASEDPFMLETWSKYEYDRSPSNDYDPEYARRQWEDEEMEEKERQLDDRWTYLERALPSGVQCDERIQYNIQKRKIAEMEAMAERQERDRRAAAKLQLQQTRAQRARERAAVAAAKADLSAAGGHLEDPAGADRVVEAERRQKLSEMLDREVMQLESNMAEIRSVLATIERRSIHQHMLLLHEIARLDAFRAEIKDVLEELDELDNADDAFTPDDAEAWKKEIEKIRAAARSQAAQRLSQPTGQAERDAGDGASNGTLPTAGTQPPQSATVQLPSTEGTTPQESEADTFDVATTATVVSEGSVGLAATRSSIDFGKKPGARHTTGYGIDPDHCSESTT